MQSIGLKENKMNESDSFNMLLKCIAQATEQLNDDLENALQLKDRKHETEALQNDVKTIEEQVSKIQRCLQRLTKTVDDYKYEYYRYRREYEKLVNSSSIRSVLDLKRRIGRTYELIYPANIPSDDFEAWNDLMEEIEFNPVDIPGKVNQVKLFKETWRRSIQSILESNGSAYYERAPIKIGIITDEYMFNYYKDAANFFYIDAEKYREQFDELSPDFVMYVSCWQGMKEGDYAGIEGREKAADILGYARSRGIKTVFQTIEDPPHFDKFLIIAQQAQYIFTADISMLELYRERTKSSNVFFLEYGINPLLHNPIGFIKNKNSVLSRRDVFFAGSWYADFPLRCLDCERIFNGVLESRDAALIIADRNYGVNSEDTRMNIFPQRYKKYLVPAIDHEELQKVHRLFDYSICLNSIKDSSTMCAMRVYELQALGSLMFSNYSKAVSKRFPSLFTISNQSEIAHILDGYTEEDVLSMQLEGIRRVFSKCTVFDRLNEIFDRIEIPYRFPEKNVALVVEDVCIESDVIQNYQSADNYEVIRKSEYQINELSSKFDFVIFANEKLWEHRHFLEDAINAFKFVDVSYVRGFDDDDALTAYDYCSGSAPLENVLYAVKRIDLRQLEDDAYRASLKGFAIVDAEIKRNTKNREKKLGVLIPVYNDGVLLRDRCILSLLRSSAYNDMHIYLLDKGSTDSLTLSILDDIQSRLDNVDVYVLDNLESDDIFSVWNQGIELCQEEYIAFAQPGSECINDGYAILLSALLTQKMNIAFGDSLSISAPLFEPMATEWERSSYFSESSMPMFKKQNLVPIDIQSIVIKHDYLKECGLRNIAWTNNSGVFLLDEILFNDGSVYYYDKPCTVHYPSE